MSVPSGQRDRRALPPPLHIIVAALFSIFISAKVQHYNIDFRSIKSGLTRFIQLLSHEYYRSRSPLQYTSLSGPSQCNTESKVL